MTAFTGPEIVLFAACAGLVCGVAGGYGGLKLLSRTLYRELGEVGADLQSFDLRIKKLEGRDARTRATPGGAPPKELAELAQLLGRGPRVVPNAQETEAEIVQRAFAGKPTKVSASGDE